jgi:hypothetical protein
VAVSRLAPYFLPRASTSVVPLAVWGAAALLSVGAASVIALQPGYLADLWQLRDWLGEWLTSGGNPYRTFAELDYPPNAFVVLWPWSWLDAGAVPLAFIPIAIASTAAATWLLSGWFAQQCGVVYGTRERLLLVLLMLAGSSMRGALWRGQLAPLAFLFGAAALHWSSRRPLLSAMALALCAFKPHVALGFAFAILVTCGWRILLIGGAAAVALSVPFALRAGMSVTSAWWSYVSNLLFSYGGEERVRGLLSIRWVIEDVVGSYAVGTALYLVVALVTLAMIGVSARSARRSHKGARSARAGQQMALVAAAMLMWTLIMLPHQLYHGWMAAPALWLMMWPESGLIASERIRVWAVAVFVLFGVIDVPRVIRLLVDVDAYWTIGWLSYALSPLRIGLLFALLLWTLERQRPAVGKLGRVSGR